MTHFGLYRSTADTQLCHMYVPEYHKGPSGLIVKDLCGTNMTTFVRHADSLDEVKGYKLCRKCKLVYIMLELAE